MSVIKWSMGKGGSWSVYAAYAACMCVCTYVSWTYCYLSGLVRRVEGGNCEHIAAEWKQNRVHVPTWSISTAIVLLWHAKRRTPTQSANTKYKFHRERNHTGMGDGA